MLGQHMLIDTVSSQKLWVQDAFPAFIMPSAEPCEDRTSRFTARSMD